MMRPRCRYDAGSWLLIPGLRTWDKGCYPEYEGSTLSKFGLFDPSLLNGYLKIDIVRESPLGITPFRDITLGLPSRCKLRAR
jgi:hypothetical protein